MASPFWSPSRAGQAARLLLALGAGVVAGCQHVPAPAPKPAPVPVVAPPPIPPPPLPLGDVIIVAGQRFHTGTRVITWLEPGAYHASPKNIDVRLAPEIPGSKAPRQVIPADLPALQGFVDQLVLHYDQAGLSRLCFEVLEKRGLSVHFMVDVDGTVYQTLDLAARALHATTSNSRSVGIEIANIGAYPPAEQQNLAKWYRRDKGGQIRLQPPKEAGDPRIHTPGFSGSPARPAPVRGVVQGRALVQYDYTPEQYAALAKLTAALCRVFPLIKCDYPRDAAGGLIRHKLPDAALDKYQGILGHYHVQENKTDPGPAFDWDRLVAGARALPK